MARRGPEWIPVGGRGIGISLRSPPAESEERRVSLQANGQTTDGMPRTCKRSRTAERCKLSRLPGALSFGYCCFAAFLPQTTRVPEATKFVPNEFVFGQAEKSTSAVVRQTGRNAGLHGEAAPKGARYRMYRVKTHTKNNHRASDSLYQTTIPDRQSPQPQ